MVTGPRIEAPSSSGGGGDGDSGGGGGDSGSSGDSGGSNDTSGGSSATGPTPQRAPPDPDPVPEPTPAPTTDPEPAGGGHVPGSPSDPSYDPSPEPTPEPEPTPQPTPTDQLGGMPVEAEAGTDPRPGTTNAEIERIRDRTPRANQSVSFGTTGTPGAADPYESTEEIRERTPRASQSRSFGTTGTPGLAAGPRSQAAREARQAAEGVAYSDTNLYQEEVGRRRTQAEDVSGLDDEERPEEERVRDPSAGPIAQGARDLLGDPFGSYRADVFENRQKAEEATRENRDAIQQAGWDVADALWKDISGEASLYEQGGGGSDEMDLKGGPGPLGLIGPRGASVQSYIRAFRGTGAAAEAGAATAGTSTTGGASAAGGGGGFASGASTAVDDVLTATGLAASGGFLGLGEGAGELGIGEQNQDVTEVNVPEEEGASELDIGPTYGPELFPESASSTEVNELEVGEESAPSPTEIQTSELVQPEQYRDLGEETPDELFVGDGLDYIRSGDEIIITGEREPEFYDDRSFPTGESAVVGRWTGEADVAEGAEDVAEQGEQIGVDVGTETGRGPFGGSADDVGTTPALGQPEQFDVPPATVPWLDQPQLLENPTTPAFETPSETVDVPGYENPPGYQQSNPPEFEYPFQTSPPQPPRDEFRDEGRQRGDDDLFGGVEGRLPETAMFTNPIADVWPSFGESEGDEFGPFG